MSRFNDPIEQAARARELLDVFLDHGEVLSDRRHVIHFFYGEEGRIDSLAADLAQLGYEARVTPGDRDHPDGPFEPGVTAETWAVTDRAWADEEMDRLCAIANEHGVVYDGWEAEMVRQPRGALQ